MYSADIVLIAIKMISDKISFNKIGKKLNISRQIISIWNNKYKNHFDEFYQRMCNKINNTKKTYPNNIINHIIRLIKKNPHLTRKDVINNIKNNFNVKLTYSDIRNIYKTSKIVKKKIKKLVAKNEIFLDDLRIKRNNFIDDIANYNINKIISFPPLKGGRLVMLNHSIIIHNTDAKHLCYV
jgi:transposase